MSLFTTKNLLYIAILFVASMIVVSLYTGYVLFSLPSVSVSLQNDVVQDLAEPEPEEDTVDAPKTAEERLQIIQDLADTEIDIMDDQRRAIIEKTQEEVDSSEQSATAKQRMEVLQGLSGITEEII